MNFYKIFGAVILAIFAGGAILNYMKNSNIKIAQDSARYVAEGWA